MSEDWIPSGVLEGWLAGEGFEPPQPFRAKLFGIFPAYADRATFIQHVGQIWLVVGFDALLFRTVQLFFIRDVQTLGAWRSKF